MTTKRLVGIDQIVSNSGKVYDIGTPPSSGKIRRIKGVDQVITLDSSFTLDVNAMGYNGRKADGHSPTASYALYAHSEYVNPNPPYTSLSDIGYYKLSFNSNSGTSYFADAGYHATQTASASDGFNMFIYFGQNSASAVPQDKQQKISFTDGSTAQDHGSVGYGRTGDVQMTQDGNHSLAMAGANNTMSYPLRTNRRYSLSEPSSYTDWGTFSNNFWGIDKAYRTAACDGTNVITTWRKASAGTHHYAKLSFSSSSITEQYKDVLSSSNWQHQPYIGLTDGDDYIGVSSYKGVERLSFTSGAGAVWDNPIPAAVYDPSQGVQNWLRGCGDGDKGKITKTGGGTNPAAISYTLSYADMSNAIHTQTMDSKLLFNSYFAPSVASGS